MKHKKFEVNTAGRDFICGDLHGAYELLVNAMQHLDFDKTKDRMFSVGDLVDRGPQNMECLRLLTEPWFHAVRGNHEQMMIDSVDQHWFWIWSRNGGAWQGDGDQPEFDYLCEIADQLPVMITVPGQFHVIHAELFMPQPITDADLDVPEIFDEITTYQSSDGDYVIWGRYMFGAAYGTKMDERRISKLKTALEMHGVSKLFTPELSHIYCGHSIMREPLRIFGQTNIDTGAYKAVPVSHNDLIYGPNDGCGLTITEPATDRFWKTDLTGTTEVTCVVINNE